jgi:CRISPR-associated protein Cas6
MGPIKGGRLKLRLHAEGHLPVTYREDLQAALYRALPSPLGETLHDRGLVSGGRPLKLFVFSRLLGLRYLPEAKAFAAEGELTLYFASALEEVLSGLVRGLWERGGLEVHGLPLRLLGLELEPLPPGGRVVVEALAPITVYRTEGGVTRYFNPLNREFGLLLEANLQRKAEALGIEAGPLPGAAHGLPAPAQAPGAVQGHLAGGVDGALPHRGPPHLVRLALLSGLGAKNSQGFGFVTGGGGC